MAKALASLCLPGEARGRGCGGGCGCVRHRVEISILWKVDVYKYRYLTSSGEGGSVMGLVWCWKGVLLFVFGGVPLENGGHMF